MERSEPSKLFTWGLDMAGLAGSLNSLSAAGGIGGLLATRDRGADLGSSTDDKSYAHFYDGNGNTVQLVQVGNDTTVAAYELRRLRPARTSTTPMAKLERVRRHWPARS